MQQKIINKTIIRNFYRRVLSQGDIDYAEQIIADNYVQHSPSLKPGKAGLMEALRCMKQIPKSVATSAPFMRLIAEGDYVVTNLSFEWEGKRKAVVDLFRLRDGKVAEHWDAVEEQSETTLNGHALMDGTMPVVDPKLTLENKKTTAEFYQCVFIDGQIEALADFVADDLVQHIPEIANGIVGLSNYVEQQASRTTVENVQRTIGEGNFVVIQSQGELNQKPIMLYDIFRLHEGKIVEQWGLKQINF